MGESSSPGEEAEEEEEEGERSWTRCFVREVLPEQVGPPMPIRRALGFEEEEEGSIEEVMESI